ncbi:MAG: peptidylprolyl isomerase [Gemmatimonadetes bacterium]|nr:peptidylprolyl isomerase [Gemmatimonadota bacterium]
MAVLSTLGWAGATSAQAREQPVQLEIRTELGVIKVEVYPDRAPITVANFLRYVDGGYYDGGSFHRTVHDENQPNDSVRIVVIQGDMDRSRGADGFGAIELERTHLTGLLHVDGAISMARSGPDSATSSFFICVGDQHELDFEGRRNPDGQGFAAFGVVVDGMDVVRAINRSPAEGQSLAPPIRILGVDRSAG